MRRRKSPWNLHGFYFSFKVWLWLKLRRKKREALMHLKKSTARGGEREIVAAATKFLIKMKSIFEKREGKFWNYLSTFISLKMTSVIIFNAHSSRCFFQRSSASHTLCTTFPSLFEMWHRDACLAVSHHWCVVESWRNLGVFKEVDEQTAFSETSLHEMLTL